MSEFCSEENEVIRESYSFTRNEIQVKPNK